jgi:integrase
VSASTQNQDFSALLLLFREVLRVDLEEMAQTVRARRGPKLPTVLSVSEVQQLLSAVEPAFQLMVKLLYGSGLRLGELVRLRVKDLDLDAGLVVVRSGKDRATLLPVALHEGLRAHLVRLTHCRPSYDRGSDSSVTGDTAGTASRDRSRSRPRCSAIAVPRWLAVTVM